MRRQKVLIGSLVFVGFLGAAWTAIALKMESDNLALYKPDLSQILSKLRHPSPSEETETSRETAATTAPATAVINPSAEAISNNVESEPESVVLGGDLAEAPSKNFYERLGPKKKLSFVRTATDPQGFYRTTAVYEVKNFKYPLVRVTERLKESDANAGAEKEDEVVGRSAMVADHILVRVKEGSDAQAVEKLITAQGCSIRGVELEARFYYLEFSHAEETNRLGEVLKAFLESPLIEGATPDYLTTIPDSDQLAKAE